MGSSLSKPESSFSQFFRAGFDKIFRRKTTAPSAPPASGTQLPLRPLPSSNANRASPSVRVPTPPAVAQPMSISAPAPTSASNEPARKRTPSPSAHDGPALPPSSKSTTAPAASASKSTPVVAPEPPSNASNGTQPRPTSTAASAPPPTPKSPTTGVWATLETSLRVLHTTTEVFPPVQTTVGLLITCLDLMQQMSKNHDDREELAAELTTLSNLMAQHLTQSSSTQMTDAVANFVQGLEEQLKILESGRNKGAGWRVLEANAREEQLSRCYRRIGSLFRQLQASAQLSIWSIVNEQKGIAQRDRQDNQLNQQNHQLDRLSPVHLAKYDSTLSTSINRRTCTANTRTAILSGLNDWSRDPSEADIYWMNGMAGTGKTTIACTFAEALGQRKQLAASFFCTRTTPECRAVTRIIPTIAYQLARSSILFRSALCESLQVDPDAGSVNITKQFDQLLKQPLLTVGDAMPRNLVVVIDALDECDDMREVELLLTILLKNAADVPIRFFVTSRPEPEVYTRMQARSHGRTALHLHEVEKSLVQADIQLYLEAELKSIAAPTPAQIQELTQRSGALFIYAATLVRYIQSRNPRGRLESVLSAGPAVTKQHADIDTLYRTILKATVDNKDLEEGEADNMRRVLGVVICAQEPVSIPVLAELAGLNSEQTLVALEPLQAVIYRSEATGLVSTLHASFPDYMLNKTRSEIYFCDPVSQNAQFTQQCFNLMKSKLQFNICKLESSFVPDGQVKDLEERVEQNISPELWYACRYWVDHLQQTGYSDALGVMLDEFLSDQLLFWMEVMNLKRGIGMGVGILTKVKLCVPAGIRSSDIARRVEDCRNFAASFAGNPVSQSTPHLYVSALPFCPRSSFVYKQYYGKTRGLIGVTGDAMRKRELGELASWEVGWTVWSVAYSPDGSRVAYGCGNGTISLRDANDGMLVVGPCEGHTDSVMSVAYSPDGTRIVSGSFDKTIRVWNATDGTLVASPFQGHTELVWSVAYSPDGTRIVSGSEDKTIRVWNATDGTLVAGPFQGHTQSVESVVYSPDGTRIVSGSSDMTVRVWNATNGTLIAGPFQGHSELVYSVAYSPDGTRIVSGSEDKTIRVWNATDGTLVASPFEGHTDSVISAAYSPDGTRIVSGSLDKTIRVWNATDGTLIAGPFQGHTRSVYSVAYSPDGTRIISGSLDKTIRVWNATDGTLVASPFQGHTSSVYSVAYSPDGTRIVSGSWDNAIRVWNATDGTLVAGPFQGHTRSVYSVAYSPDGTRIVSGSSDMTIRVWNATEGTLVAGPFQGHTNLVLSVAYSPDGTRIISGSEDNTIRVWNATDGTLVASPFQGHTYSVYSVAYSPDGTRIVSGSVDETIRVWNATDGTLVASPFQGHTSSVYSVAYSPDGTRIVSGSLDNTIRVWNATDGTLVAGPFQGHTSSVKSVAYSPDGTRIVSGSNDHTIRVWNATDGTLVAGPFQGHTDLVWSVAYSPDGTRIVSGSEDKTIRVWNATDGTLIAGLLEGHVDLAAPAEPQLNDGWVTTSDSSLLFWIPHGLRSSFSLRCHLVISSSGTLLFDFSNLVLGKRWAECFPA